RSPGRKRAHRSRTPQAVCPTTRLIACSSSASSSTDPKASRPSWSTRRSGPSPGATALATEVAVGKGDAVRVIDTFINGFEQALEDGRVRMDNPADFNTMLRLKEFLLGGPDARQEVHASLSLEDLQRRHARMMRVAGDVNADALAGVIPGRRMVEDD